jgi:MraZ protein
MFRGQFEHSIDAKGRLSIPAKFRDVLQSKSQGGSATDRLIVTNHDHCVYAYALPDFEGIEQKLAAQPQSEKVKAFSRMFIGGAHECELDPTGRILIPPPLRRYAGLEKDVVLVGVTKRFEIWSAERWKSESAKNEQVIAADHDFIPDV